MTEARHTGVIDLAAERARRRSAPSPATSGAASAVEVAPDATFHFNITSSNPAVSSFCTPPAHVYMPGADRCCCREFPADD